MARQYLALENFQQARSEALALATRFPESPLVPEARLLAARALAQAGRGRDALPELEALARGSGEIAARAAAEAAGVLADEGHLDRALALYEAALPTHPNPEAIRAHVDAVKRRRELAGVQRPGDRAAALENRTVPTKRTR